MKINNLSSNKINKNHDLEKTKNFKTKPMPFDTFEKSNVSFRGDSFDDIFNQFLDSLMETATDAMEYIHIEKEVDNLFEAFASKRDRELLKKIRNKKIEELIDILLNDKDINFVNKMKDIFRKAGFKNVQNFENFLMIYDQNPQPFIGQGVETLEIYGLLNNKRDLSQFGELLLYQYNEAFSSEDGRDYRKLNQTTAFLKEIGLNNFKDFDAKFGHLKSKFNNFENISDKSDAIEYLQQTYPAKIEMLNRILQQNPSITKQKAENLYSSITDIIDYLYEENNGESLSGLESILEYASQQNKFKANVIKPIEGLFNNLQTPEDKIDFYKFLKDCNVSISDLPKLMLKSIISDVEAATILVNKDDITEIIKTYNKKSTSDSNEFYKQFKDVLNAAYNENSDSTTEIRDLIGAIHKFNLKDSSALLEFYNKANGVKKSNITSEELIKFIELTKYTDSSAILDVARQQKTTAVELLRKEQECFLSVEKAIQQFIVTDETSFFTGETPFSIYKKYRESIIENPQNINTILQNIASFGITNPDQYHAKTETIKAFSEFFEDKESMINFFTKNNITLDCSEEDNIRIKNILSVLDAVNDEDNKEISKRRIKYFTESGFISKSENKLGIMLSKLPSKEARQNILGLIADKKIPSLSQLEKFIKQYITINTSPKNLISYLKNLPEDIDFTTSFNRLTQLQEKIDNLVIPLNINGENIFSIDISKYPEPSKMTTEDIVSLLNGIYNSPADRNFISVMSSSDKAQGDEKIDAFRIAMEIAKSIEKTPESYKNIARLLEIDRRSLDIDKNCSTYIYAKEIQNSLPKEFINFIMSDNWTKYEETNTVKPQLTLHAKLRLIDRFALNGVKNINELYTEETTQKLRQILKTVYTTTPTGIRGSDETKRLIVDFIHNGTEIEAVFSKEGKMVTIVPRRNSKVA